MLARGGDLAAGRRIFERKCARCHSPRGDGKTVVAGRFPYANLIDGVWRSDGSNAAIAFGVNDAALSLTANDTAVSLTGTNDVVTIAGSNDQITVSANDTTLNQWFTESQFESYRGLGHHAQVAPQRKLHAAGHRMTFDRRDHRLRQMHAGRTHRSVAMKAHAVALALGQCLQVGTGAKAVALALQDRNERLVVGLEAAKRIGQLGGRRRIDRIAPLGPMDRHDGNVPRALV